MKRRTGIKVAAIAAAGALLLSACSTSTTGGGGGGEDGGVLTVGTTDKVTVLDPAGAYDHGTSLAEQQ
ncbi:peptide ABC transporter substrate-binding protein, partial [Mycobacterium tuberculosis]|nr:peptide ABC transporter substrate-binding protein [Mycobacterium tuberculosis]